MRFQLADLLEEEEEWSEAARVLMGISLDSGQRCVPRYLSINGITNQISSPGQSEMRKNFASMFVSFDYCWKTKILCKPRHIIIGLLSWCTQLTIGKLFFNSSFVKRVLATTAESSWRLLVDIMNLVMSVK